jgi:hypothetical protein
MNLKKYQLDDNHIVGWQYAKNGEDLEFYIAASNGEGMYIHYPLIKDIAEYVSKTYVLAYDAYLCKEKGLFDESN